MIDLDKYGERQMISDLYDGLEVRRTEARR